MGAGKDLKKKIAGQVNIAGRDRWWIDIKKKRAKTKFEKLHHGYNQNSTEPLICGVLKCFNTKKAGHKI